MEKNTRVTINDIATSLNISAISVSRALANQPGVSNELRKKIVNKARELGYKRSKCNAKISILVLIRRRYIADQSNFSHLVENLESHIKKVGAEFTLEIVDSEKQDELVLPYHLSHGKRCDGVILLGKFEDDYAHYVQQSVPHLLILNGGSDLLECNYVYYNFSRMGYRATEYLVNKGHTKIGYLGLNGTHSRSLRFYGVHKALQKFNLDIDQKFVINTKEDYPTHINKLIKNHDLPSAFICHSDRIALKLVKLLYENGISVPQDVSVVGSGNTDMSSITIPALTTFEVNIPHVCEVAVTTLIDQINEKTKVCRTIYVDSFLVERDSVRELSAGEVDVIAAP